VNNVVRHLHSTVEQQIHSQRSVSSPGDIPHVNCEHLTRMVLSGSRGHPVVVVIHFDPDSFKIGQQRCGGGKGVHPRLAKPVHKVGKRIGVREGCAQGGDEEFLLHEFGEHGSNRRLAGISEDLG
jgi:hypothetical protein